MSTLQISLAVAGGLVLAGIVAHSAWSSRKNTPRQADPEVPPVPASESLNQQREPGFDAMGFDANGTAEGYNAGNNGTDSDSDTLSDLPKLPTPPTGDKRLGLDALIDVIAPLTLEAPIHGEVALAAMPATRRAGSKPFAVEGQNKVTQRWETPVAGQRYSSFQAGVQMANRTGALNEIEYSEFVMKAQTFADAINAATDFPEMLEAVAHARELDQFASSHDAHLGFSLRALHASWSPGYIQQAAARVGFVMGAIPGRMVLPAATAGLPPVLSLVYDPQAALAQDPAQSAVREVALNLEVPHVERGETPFVRLRQTAQTLAEAMDGVVTDGNGQPLQSEAMDQIGAELEQLYDALDARDFSAGSGLARRLFS